VDGARGRTDSVGLFDIFWILSPVWTLDSCVLERGMNLEGWRRQLRAVRVSADINVVFCLFDSLRGLAWKGGCGAMSDRGQSKLRLGRVFRLVTQRRHK
jgi:hypothetical protein